jgi:hypothetical protein
MRTGTHEFWWAPRTSNPLPGTHVSGVGSIPTRSRQFVLGGVLLLFFLILPCGFATGRAQEGAEGTASPGGRTPAAEPSATASVPDSAGRAALTGPAGPWYKEPRWIMLRSVVIPGWGQWTNGKHLKAVIVAVGEGYLIYRAVDYGRQEQAATTAAEKDYAASKRRDFTWWTIFAAALSMGDAYVDAQLGRQFDKEFTPQDQSVLQRRDDGLLLRVGLGVRLP